MLPAQCYPLVDNEVILALCENKPGIFPLLDDVCVMADATSDKLLHTLDAKLSKNEYYITNKVKDGTFTVQVSTLRSLLVLTSKESAAMIAACQRTYF